MAPEDGSYRFELTIEPIESVGAFASRTWSGSRKRWAVSAAYVILVCAITGIVVIPQVAAAILPLGSDQGLYITIGEILNRGGVIGRDAWDSKPPGVYYLYAAILHFAPDYSLACTIPLRLLTVSTHVIPCAQIVLTTFDVAYALALCAGVWLVARSLFSTAVANVAAVLCAVFSGMLQISGGGGIADMYLLLPSTLAYGAAGLYATRLHRRWLVTAGALGALAALFKQTGFVLLAGVGVWLLLFEWRRAGWRAWRTPLRSVAALAGGAIIVLTLTAVLLARSGALVDVLDQAFLFNLYYVGSPANTNDFVTQLRSQTWAVFTGSQIGLWLPAFAGLCFLAADSWSWRASLLLAWVGSSILTIAAGGSQLHVNYYLALVPALAIYAGYAITRLWAHGSVLRRAAVVAGGIVLLAASNQLQDHQYGNAWYSRILSNTHSTEEFVAGAIGRESGSLFIWGNGPQVYALSGRVPASRYLHTLAISYDYAVHDELNQNRAELIATLEESPPQVIAVDTPWLRRARTLDFPDLQALIARDYVLSNDPTNPIFDGWQIYRRRVGTSGE